MGKTPQSPNEIMDGLTDKLDDEIGDDHPNAPGHKITGMTKGRIVVEKYGDCFVARAYTVSLCGSGTSDHEKGHRDAFTSTADEFNTDEEKNKKRNATEEDRAALEKELNDKAQAKSDKHCADEKGGTKPKKSGGDNK